jgi:histidinol-phosphate aminotransferase
MLNLAPSHILAINPYIPSRPDEMIKEIHSWARLGANENCLGASSKALTAAAESLYEAHLYPTSRRADFVQNLAHYFREYDVRPAHIALGNGTSELIVNLVRGLLEPHEAMLFIQPSFIMYQMAARAHGRKEVAVPVLENMHFDLPRIIALCHEKSEHPVKVIFLANPNNPTGSYVKKAELENFMRELPKSVVLVLDEAYIEYVNKSDFADGLNYVFKRPRTVLLRTFSKIYGLAGLRLGYAIGDESIISVLCRVRDPFNVNMAVQAAGIAALDDQEHVNKSRAHNAMWQPKLAEILLNCGFKVVAGEGNFVMAKRQESMPSCEEIASQLLGKGVIIRTMASFGEPEYFRVSVGTGAEINQFQSALKQII